LIQLAAMAKVNTNQETALAIGCTYSAVACKKHELGLSGHRTNSAAITAYATRYDVTRQTVLDVGVARLDRMGEEARALLLHLRDTPDGTPTTRR
jgi:ABC-type transporter Mla MlaB component